MRTLVLNAGYEPMQLVSWQKALCLVLANKAEVIVHSETIVRSVKLTMKLPSVVRLIRYVQAIGKLGLVRCSRKNVLLRDRYQCQYCGVLCRPNTATIDHIVPRSRGGKTTWMNVVTACAECNRHKGSRSLDGAGMRLLRTPRRPSWNELADELRHDPSFSWLPFLDRLLVMEEAQEPDH